MCYGPEFVATAVREWLGRLGVTTLYIEPGSPWENGYIERLGFARLRPNARLRDELLNGEIFCSLEEVRIVSGWWRDHYNRARPHSSLGYRPPAPETIKMPVSTNYATGPVIAGSPGADGWERVPFGRLLLALPSNLDYILIELMGGDKYGDRDEGVDRARPVRARGKG